MAKLKVFRTPIGFHDAYVAAPSRKAALAAWGSDKDLFARGVAEEVTDPALSKAPLAEPGTVVRVLRGSAVEQLAAGGRAGGGKAKARAKPVPRPRRDALDKAEAAVRDIEARFDREDAALAAEAKRIERKRTALAKRRAAEVGTLAKARDRAEAAHERALAKWRG